MSLSATGWKRALITAAAVGSAVAVACGSDETEPASAGSPPAVQTAASTVQPSVDAPVPDIPVQEPGFSLISTNGGVVNFSELRGTVALGIFFFGDTDCPGCEQQLADLQANYTRFRDAGAELIAISTDRPERARRFVDANDLDFPVLIVVDGSVASDWGFFDSDGHTAPSFVVFSMTGEEIGRYTAASASELPGIEELLTSLAGNASDAGVAASTPTPRPAEAAAATTVTANPEPDDTPAPAEPTIAAVPATTPPERSPVQGSGPAAGTTATSTPPPTSTPAPPLLGPGVTDFKLPDAVGRRDVVLSELLAEENVVLVLYRAFW